MSTRPSHGADRAEAPALDVRMRFLRAVVRRRIAEGEGIPPPPTAGGAVTARTLLDAAVDLYLRWKWCRDVEAALDSGTQFLRDNWDILTEEQRKEYEADLVRLLDSYTDIC